METNQIIENFHSLGYTINSIAEVFGKSGLKLSIHRGTNGYMQVNTWSNGKQRTFLIHRLVASKYIDNPNNYEEVNHKDGDKLNNLPYNLEWVTRSQNILHGFSMGLIKKSMITRTGKKHWRSKIVEQMDLDGNIINSFDSSGDAERETGFNRTAIQDACKGKLKTYKGFTWKYKVPHNLNKES